MPLRMYFQITCQASRVKLKSMLDFSFTRADITIYIFFTIELTADMIIVIHGL